MQLVSYVYNVRRTRAKDKGFCFGNRERVVNARETGTEVGKNCVERSGNEKRKAALTLLEVL